MKEQGTMLGDEVKVSKFLRFVLRHKPGAIGLTLDSEGWASVVELLSKARPQMRLTRSLIEWVADTNDKQRFTLSEDRLYIRANQGHSIGVDLGLLPVLPPEVLYHGTAERFFPSIKEEGLKRGQRHHVHLSEDVITARAVGQRYGKPVVLSVQT